MPAAAYGGDARSAALLGVQRAGDSAATEGLQGQGAGLLWDLQGTGCGLRTPGTRILSSCRSQHTLVLLGLHSHMLFLSFKGTSSVKRFGTHLKGGRSPPDEYRLVPSQPRSSNRSFAAGDPAQAPRPWSPASILPWRFPWQLPGSQALSPHSCSRRMALATCSTYQHCSCARVSSPSALCSHHCCPLLPPSTSCPSSRDPSSCSPLQRAAPESHPNQSTFPRALRRP